MNQALVFARYHAMEERQRRALANQLGSYWKLPAPNLRLLLVACRLEMYARIEARSREHGRRVAAALTRTQERIAA